MWPLWPTLLATCSSATLLNAISHSITRRMYDVLYAGSQELFPKESILPKIFLYLFIEAHRVIDTFE
jgi:hypothetical protein